MRFDIFSRLKFSNIISKFAYHFVFKNTLFSLKSQQLIKNLG